MCAAGAETTPWKNPSSSGQLPVPVALNASLPTLFKSYYTRRKFKSKDLNGNISKFLSNRVVRFLFAGP